MQSNQDTKNEVQIIDSDVWDILLNKLKQRESLEEVKLFILSISNNYNIDKKNIIKDFLNYIIRVYPEHITKELLNFIENLLHSQIQNSNVQLNYSLSKLLTIIGGGV